MNSVERAILIAVPAGLVVTEAVLRLFHLEDLSLIRAFSPYNSFPPLTFAAALIALLTLRRAELVPVLALALLIEAAKAALVLYRHLGLISAWSTWGIGIWYASLAISAWRTLTSRPPHQLGELDVGLLRLSLPIGMCLSLFGLELTSRYTPLTYDNFLYAYDGLFPLPLAQALASLCQANVVWRTVASIAYDGIWVVLLTLIFFQFRKYPAWTGRLMSRWLLVGLLGWMLYFAMPGVGPDVAFYARYGDALPPPGDTTIAVLPMATGTPRNAIPSLHMTWALLLALAAREMGRGWLAGLLVFVGLTAFATLGLREHYLIDLVVAVPFAVFVYSLPSLYDDATGKAWRAVLGSALLFIALMVTIRFGIGWLRHAPWIASVAALAAIAASLALHVASQPLAARLGRARQAPAIDHRSASA